MLHRLQEGYTGNGSSGWDAESEDKPRGVPNGDPFPVFFLPRGDVNDMYPDQPHADLSTAN